MGTIITYHQGIEISKTGYSMDKAYIMRENQLKEIEEKSRENYMKMINNNRGSHMRIMGEIMSDDDENESISGNESSDSKRKKKKSMKRVTKNLTDNRGREL